MIKVSPGFSEHHHQGHQNVSKPTVRMQACNTIILAHSAFQIFSVTKNRTKSGLKCGPGRSEHGNKFMESRAIRDKQKVTETQRTSVELNR